MRQDTGVRGEAQIEHKLHSRISTHTSDATFNGLACPTQDLPSLGRRWGVLGICSWSGLQAGGLSRTEDKGVRSITRKVTRAVALEACAGGGEHAQELQKGPLATGLGDMVNGGRRERDDHGRVLRF